MKVLCTKTQNKIISINKIFFEFYLFSPHFVCCPKYSCPAVVQGQAGSHETEENAGYVRKSVRPLFCGGAIHTQVQAMSCTEENSDSFIYHIFWTIRHTPQIWEESGGASYSPNVAHIYIGEILCYLCY